MSENRAMIEEANRLKVAAAESAAALVTDGMVVGLGTGSTAALAVEVLGRRVRDGLRIVGIPTSEKTAAQARALGIPLSTLTEVSEIEITIDGADEVELGSLSLIKGHGGALLREKIVASVSRRLVIVVDDSKLVNRLAAKFRVPVEVVPFGWQSTARRLSALGGRPTLRRNTDGSPFFSDGGHFILDCAFDPGADVAPLAKELDHIVGLVEHGLFIGFTPEVHVASGAGVQVLRL